MSGNPSKDVMRQPLPQGGDQSSPQDLMNQSFDPVFRTLIFQQMESSDGVNLYPSSAAKTCRYDLQALIYYIGEAPMDTADATSNWKITKFDLSTNPYSGKVAVGVQWANRATVSYT
jgi:hypothetical protein